MRKEAKRQTDEKDYRFKLQVLFTFVRIISWYTEGITEDRKVKLGRINILL